MHHRGSDRFRLRLVACCAILIAIAFIQTPGFQISDTKFDLAASPLDFLKRSLHVWDPTASFGQVQNQAYGYLWPTGAFFSLGFLAGIPAWIVQRLWLGVVLSVAFLGAAKLLRLFGVRRDAAVIIAALAYATSPAILTKIGPISSEAWTLSVAPWVLIPLVIGMRRGTPWCAGLLAAVAVAMAGGINAVATAAVLPLGVIWLITRSRGWRQWKILGWWTGFTVITTAWWLVPLMLQGRFSPPFLDYIESAQTTTFANNLFDALRGTTHWVAYVETSWAAGHELITTGFLALDAAFIIGLGLIGIIWRTQPERLFLLAGLGAGLLLVTMGHHSGAQGWFTATFQGLLDGSLAPARNLHKFDSVVRIPLIVGLGWALQVALDSSRRVPLVTPKKAGQPRISLAPGKALVGLAVLALVAGATPAWAGRMAPTSPVLDTPGYWHEAIDWVDQRDRGVALLLPGSSFAHYLWGSPDDEPAQYLDAESWAVRHAVPLAPAGNVRMLDAIESRLSQGKPSAGLADYLSRAGVGYLLVRNDLVQRGDQPADALVVRSITGSPGLTLASTFGPQVGGEPVVAGPTGRLVPESGARRLRQAIEVYRVDPAPAATQTSALPVVVGGSEDLLDLADQGLIGSEATVLAPDLAAAEAAGSELPVGQTILTDGMLDREQSFGRIHESYSAVRTPGDVRRTGNKASDYTITPGKRWRTTSRLIGAEALSASSSRSDATAIGGAEPGKLPLAAIDANSETQWASDFSDDAAWWQIDFTDPQTLATLTVTTGDLDVATISVWAETEAGRSEPVSFQAGARHRIDVPRGDSRWLRLHTTAGVRLTLAEVEIPGVSVSRQLVLPELEPTWSNPDVIALRALRDARTGCLQVANRVPCVAANARTSEEPAGFGRVVTLNRDATWVGSLQVQARPGEALNELLQDGYAVSVDASSTAIADPRASAVAVLDGRRGTTWVAEESDERPQLRLSWLGKRKITGLTLAVQPSAPVSRPTRVVVQDQGRSEFQVVELNSKGYAELDKPLVTDGVTVTITDSESTAVETTAGEWQTAPIGVSTLRVEGINRRPLVPAGEVRNWGCGSGPMLSVGGATVATQLVASPAQLFAMQPVRADLCGELSMEAGENTVIAGATPSLVPTGLTLANIASAGAATAEVAPVDLVRVDQTDRRLTPGVTEVSVIDQVENLNAGWRATQAGKAAVSVPIDGWRQGWLTDGSTAAIEVTFPADGIYRIALGGGLIALLAAAVVALRRPFFGADSADLTADQGAGKTTGRLGPIPVATAVVLLGGLVAGWSGFAVIAASMAIGTVLRRRGPALAAEFVMMAPLLGAGLGYMAGQIVGTTTWAGFWAWPAYLVLVALGVAVSALIEPKRPTLVSGNSTKR